MNNATDERIFDYRKLKGRIVEKFDTLALFAEAIGKKPQQVTSKINDGTAFNSNTIMDWANPLDIPTEEYGTYFFTLKV